MSQKRRIRNSSLLTLGIAAGVMLGQSAHAQSFSLIGGGSSALQGDYSASTSFRQGATPLAIQNLVPVANYKLAADNDTNNVFVTSGNIQITGTNSLSENATAAMIRYVGTWPNVKIIILIRTDSGFGVRYIANQAQINSWTGVTFRKVSQAAVLGNPGTPTAADFTVVTPNAAGTTDQKVLNFIVTNAGANEKIDTGFSDVTADTVVNYGSFPIDSTNLGTLVGAGSIQSGRLAVLTLLPLYNSNVHTLSGQDFKVNFTRDMSRAITNGGPGDAGLSRGLYWSQIDPRLKNGANEIIVSGAYRETSSGTRLTQFLNVMRYGLGGADTIGEGSGGFIVDPKNNVNVAANNNPQLGTGNMTTSIRLGSGVVAGLGGSFGAVANGKQGAVVGYSFITGSVASNLNTVRVGLYNGVAPYKTAGSAAAFNTQVNAQVDGASLSLPGLNGQVSYGDVATSGNYYTETANGRYQLWTNAIYFTNTTIRNTDTVTDSGNGLAALLNDPAVQPAVNALGLTQTSQMNVGRAAFVSPTTGEAVTDGGYITYGPDNYGLIIE